MDWKILGVVFVVHRRNGRQDATRHHAVRLGQRISKWTIFLGASLALVAASDIGALAGSALSNHVNEKYLHCAAGAGFVIIGLWTLWKA